jgi:alkenylglycerophosphocholine hydrolase
MLAVAITMTAITAMANWWSRVRPAGHLETISKPLTTVLMIWVACAANGPRTATILAVIALIFCLIGDVALLDIVDKFIVGLGAFLVGHLVFIAVFVTRHLSHPWWGLPALAVIVVAGVVCARPIIAGAASQNAQLKVPVTLYFVAISCMFVIAAMTGNWWAIAGAGAFVISDSLLGLRQFVREARGMAVAVMITYHTALFCLALSLHS